MQMLNVEICINNNEINDLEPGTYNLNTQLGPNIYICEYQNYKNNNKKSEIILNQRKLISEENRNSEEIENSIVLFDGYITYHVTMNNNINQSY